MAHGNGEAVSGVRRAYASERVFEVEHMLEDHAVVVENNVVAEVVQLRELSPDVPLHRQPGCTLIPGLIDTHVHFMRWQGAVFSLNPDNPDAS